MSEETEHGASEIVLREKRPDGSRAFVIAQVLVYGGFLAVAVSFFVEVEKFGEIDLGQLSLRWALQAAGGGALSLAILIGLAGYIVHALSFLPGQKER